MKRNILTGFLSLAIAFGLWLYVVTVVSPNSDNTYNGVSVTIQGEAALEERGLMITTRQIPTVSLRLEGNRSELQKLNSSNISVSVDVSKILEPGEHSLPISANNVRLPGDVSYSAVTVASRNPDYIKLEVKRREDKQVPVEVLFTGTETENYHVDEENKTLDYPQIIVSGPADALADIAVAQITMDLTGKTGTITENLPFTLCNDQGEPVDAQLITTNTGLVELSVNILPEKEVSLELEVIDGSGATRQTTSIELEYTSIRVFGSESILKDLEHIVLGTIDLSELLEDTTRVFTIELPEGVSNATELKEVLVKISFPELETKTVTVSNIATANIPNGKKAELVTKTLDIQFRGPKELIQNLKPEDVTVTVDLTDAQPGEQMLPGVVTLTEQFAQIGTLGDCTVTVTLK